MHEVLLCVKYIEINTECLMGVKHFTSLLVFVFFSEGP